MNIQLVIVILIGIAVLGVVARNVYRFFFVKKESGYCGGCSGCEVGKQEKG